MTISKFLPRFKLLYILIGSLNLILAGGILLQGAETAMAPFGVPIEVLKSPHYQDGIWWVYSHMFVLGGMILLLGFLLKDLKSRMWMSRFLCLVHVYYTYLDFRSSDSVLGNGLYQGEASVMPAFIALTFTLAFLYLSLSRRANS